MSTVEGSERVLVPNMVASPQGGSPRNPHEPELDAFDQDELDGAASA